MTVFIAKDLFLMIRLLTQQLLQLFPIVPDKSSVSSVELHALYLASD